MIAWCKENMASYKYPRFVEIMDELPKTTSGKILRRMLQPARVPAAAVLKKRPVVAEPEPLLAAG